MQVVESLSRRGTRDGLRLSVLHREGEPMVLFLHGLAGYGGEWLHVCRYLDNSVGLLLPDQRGHGLNGHSSSMSRSDFVGDAIDVVERLAGEGPVIVVGQSMGGIVATLMASERAELISALVLIETGMEAMTSLQADVLAAWLESWAEGFGSEDEALAFFGGGTPSARAWVDGLERSDGRLRGRFDPGQMVETMRNLASDARWPEWESIEVDTTVVTASSSAVSRTDLGRMLQSSPAIQHVVVEDSGHDVHLDQPAGVADVISSTVEKATQPRA